MRLQVSFIACVLVALTCLLRVHATTQIIGLVELFRHGDRAPEQLMPNDPFANNIAGAWPMGLGELTPIGMSQHFHLGLQVRTSYSSVIGTTFRASNVFVRSTNIDRTLMSAASQFSGTFNNSGPAGLFPGNFQPVPIHSVVPQEDYLLLGMREGQCPQLDASYAEKRASAAYANVSNIYMPWMRSAAAKAGYDPSSINLENIFPVIDSLICYQSHNNMAPMYSMGFTDADVTTAMAVQDDWYAIMYSGDTLRKFGTGVLLGGVLDLFSNLATPSTAVGYPRFAAFSAHDITVASMLATLGVYGQIRLQPPYAAHLFLELHNDTVTNSQYVRVVYQNQTYALPDCGNVAMCPLQTFSSVLSKYVLKESDYVSACQIPATAPSDKKSRRYGGSENLAYGLASLGSLFLLFIMVVMYMTRNAAARKKEKRLLKELKQQHGGDGYSAYQDSHL